MLLKNIIFSLIYIIVINLNIISPRYVIFELNNLNTEKLKKIQEKEFSIENLINDFLPNQIYTTIKLGTPPKIVKTWIETDEYGYFLQQDICELNSFFDITTQESYKQLNFTKDRRFYYREYGKAFYCNTPITLRNQINKTNNEIMKEDFPFMFMPDPKNDNTFMEKHKDFKPTGNSCATIGTRRTANYMDITTKNFIEQLKKADVIDSYSYFIEYDEKGNEKYLVIGAYPEEVFPNKYQYKDMKSTYIGNFNRLKIQWGIKFDKVEWGGKGDKSIREYGSRDAGFHYNLGVIYGVQEYKNYLLEGYFKNYIDKENKEDNICNLINYQEYQVFVCDKNRFKDWDMKNFPGIRFIKTDMEMEFILDYKDLFITRGEKIFFLVVFHQSYNEIWELGKPFLKKYFFVYNFDSKLIGYYTKINRDFDRLRENEILESQKNIRYYVIIVFLSIVFGVVAFILGKKVYDKRKKMIKAKELEQSFSHDYTEFSKSNIDFKNNKEMQRKIKESKTKYHNLVGEEIKI